MNLSDWKLLVDFLSPTTVVLLIVIFWLMKQNSRLVKEVFSVHSNLGRLTSLLETLVFEKRG